MCLTYMYICLEFTRVDDDGLTNNIYSKYTNIYIYIRHGSRLNFAVGVDRERVAIADSRITQGNVCVCAAAAAYAALYTDGTPSRRRGC